MAAVVGAEPCRSQEPGTPAGSPAEAEGVQVIGPASAALPGT